MSAALDLFWNWAGFIVGVIAGWLAADWVGDRMLRWLNRAKRELRMVSYWCDCLLWFEHRQRSRH